MTIIHAQSTVATLVEEWTLAGSSGSPTLSTDFAISPANAQCGFAFNADGTIDRNQNGSTSFFANFSSFATTPRADIWMRLTLDANDFPNVGGLSAGVWYQVVGGSNRVVQWLEDTDGFAVTTGVVKVELCTVGDCSNIVATGYYKGTSSIEV